MAVFVDADTKVIVQGLTGGQGKFHGLRNRDYGTQVVGGVTPGKGGQDVEGVPVLDTVEEAVREHGANTSMVFVPAPFAADAVYEAVDAGIKTVIAITEGVPAHDMLRIHSYVRARGARMLGQLSSPRAWRSDEIRHPVRLLRAVSVSCFTNSVVTISMKGSG